MNRHETKLTEMDLDNSTNSYGDSYHANASGDLPVNGDTGFINQQQ